MSHDWRNFFAMSLQTIHACFAVLVRMWLIMLIFPSTHTSFTIDLDRGGIQCVLTLLESGAAVNCQDDSGASPLHYAIDAGFGEDTETSDLMIKHLLKYGADTTLADKNGRLPLHWAANAGA